MSAFPEMPREWVIDDEITLRPHFESPDETYALIDRNRAYLGEFLVFATPEYSPANARMFAEAKRADWGVRGEQAFGIWRRSELAGSLGMRGFESMNGAVEIGYWLTQDLQGRGIMTRCVTAAVKFCFESCGMNQVVIKAAPHNTRSRAIPERLGFTQVGIDRQWSRNARGELLDLVSYSLLRSEWEERG